MSDFWAGYISGAVGIVVGNPLDILKTRLQAGSTATLQTPLTGVDQAHARKGFAWTAWLRGSAAPVLGYGALNALLFMTYNRSLALLNTGHLSDLPERPSGWTLWTAGALGGLATFVVSAPTELVKCRAQVSGQSSVEVTKALWRQGRVRGLYMGGAVTSARDALRALTFAQDVIKTRVQTWDLVSSRQASSVPDPAGQPLLAQHRADGRTHHAASWNSLRIAKEAYAIEGISVFFRGLGVCSARAFIVNAVQWAVYEYLMKQLAR
ncbi:hypothetical protein LTR53_012340 [Teratosphaeriaceae sp. CCFEE 6253]|nr:hypothetical protein LTR53_012340 [Teratosphaeriaceae sp. CCFEE 6253]